jgi:hypothetical protein
MSLKPFRNLRLQAFTAGTLATVTGNSGDLYYDVTAKTLRLFDGAQPGGYALARADLTNVTNSVVSAKVVGSGALSWNNITGKPTVPSLGAVTVEGTVIDSQDSSAITFTPLVVFNSDISVENDIIARGEIRTAGGDRYATETLVNSLISQSPIDYNNLLNLPAAFLGLSDLQMSVGVAINEFSIDPTFADNSISAVPVEQAIRGYIDRRLGFDSEGAPVSEQNKIGPVFVNIDGQQQVDLANQSFSTDANWDFDASTIMLGAWVANFTATRTLIVSNLTAGRRVEVFVKNTNGSSRSVTVTASTTDTGHALVDMANGLGGPISNGIQLANGGAAVFRIWNAGGVIVGEVL